MCHRRGMLWTFFLVLAGSCVAESAESGVSNQTCGERNFQCVSGECINYYLQCDGAKDCKDGSDETLAQCSSLRCPETTFRCAYGACIPKSALCDGTIHCEGDGSDEDHILCGTPHSTKEERRRRSITDCGKTIPQGLPLEADGIAASPGETPWHVQIFLNRNGGFLQVCGGTIISRKLIITAAHCFTNSKKPGDYKIAAGKYQRNWETKASTEQQFDVDSIEIKPTYLGEAALYRDDIAIVVLKDEIAITDFVRPVCLDLENEYTDLQLSTNSIGSVAGGSQTENYLPNDPLLVTRLPVVGWKQCIETVPIYFRPYFTSDKFCAGYINGSAVCRGDGGSGLTFKQQVTTTEIRWFLQGVVSLAVAPANYELCPRQRILLSKVATHMDWIKMFYNKY